MKGIPHQYMLTEDEVDDINDAITAYNVKLRATADAFGLAFVDVNAFINSVRTGIDYDGQTIRAKFVEGGAYSLDGVHLTPLGNALLANEFIKAINAKYGSTIPRIDATSYQGVAFP